MTPIERKAAAEALRALAAVLESVEAPKPAPVAADASEFVETKRGLARCGEQQQLGAWAVQQRTPGIVSESPLEEALRRAFLRTPYFATPRVPMDRVVGVGPFGLLLSQFETTIAGSTYRLDFALLNFGADVYIAVEVDGSSHDRPEQPQRDRIRDRALTGAGWVLQRFSGVEVHRDAGACAAELIRLARRASGLLKFGVSA